MLLHYLPTYAYSTSLPICNTIYMNVFMTASSTLMCKCVDATVQKVLHDSASCYSRHQKQSVII